MKTFVWTFSLAGLIALLTVCTNNNQQASVKAKPEENYRKYCAGCHGEQLEKFAMKGWMKEKGITTIFKSIKYGIEDMGMPAFEKTFSDQEIKELAQFVRHGIPSDLSKLKPAITPVGIINSEVQKFVIDTVVKGLEVPWGLAFLPGGDLLIAERSGKLLRFSEGNISDPVTGLPPIMAHGQGGLMDIALHPDYDKNGWIYFSFSELHQEGPPRLGNTSILRAKLDGNSLTNQEIIFRGTPPTDRAHHFGCKLAFDGKGHLYFGIGDRGQHFDWPQKLDNHNGKIHRIFDDGSIPPDNPFVNTPGAMPSIYSFGHRNPQGTCIHPETGDIWETEHGPMGGDELNLIRPAVNYGWPVISYGINYDGTILTEITEKEGMEQPVFYWVPSIAPCGMCFVTGNRYPGWKNNILIGSLRFQYVERVVLDGQKFSHREKLIEGIGRVRNVVMGPDGLVYVATEYPGMILRLIPVE